MSGEVCYMFSARCTTEVTRIGATNYNILARQSRYGDKTLGIGTGIV